MVTPSGRSTSMVMAAITVPDDQESSDPVPTVDQHLSRTVAHRGHSGKPQKPWCSHLTPEEPKHMPTASQAIFKPDGKNAIHDGIEHEPGGGRALLDPTDTVFLLLDHQSGLFQNVKDITVAELRANVTALAKLAALCQIPVITTAS